MATPKDVHGVFSWPGVESFLGGTYTMSHGISPGVCVLRCATQDDPPAEFGNLTITDNSQTVTLPDCRLQDIKVEKNERGFYWILEIADRRWRWREFGFINGCYNQMTPFAKLIPYTIRSPKELAALCLRAMGEEKYYIDELPNGLNYPGPWFPLPIINVSGVNPPVDWDGVPPAQALQQVADRCGCRIVYRWQDDSVWVGPIGAGAPLPRGENVSVAKLLPSISTPKAPSGFGVIGSPTRYQCRLALTAVGKEWDGSYWPIDLLSYAPIVTKPATVQKTRLDFANLSPAVYVNLTITDAGGIPHTISFSTGDGTLNDANANAIAAIAAANGDPEWKKVFTAIQITEFGFVFIPTVIIQAFEPNVPFNITVKLTLNQEYDPEPEASLEMIQKAAPATSRRTWENCYSPEFQGVRPTAQLSLVDAQRLAQESVFRCYQLTGIDVSGAPNIIIPGYGPLLRTMQIVLQSRQVDQVVPTPLANGIFVGNQNIGPPDAANQNQGLVPLTVNFYNGYSQDKPAVVYGSIAYSIVSGHTLFLSADGKTVKPATESSNTPAGSQVFVPFDVIPESYMIRFSTYVYAFGARIPASSSGIPVLGSALAAVQNEGGKGSLKIPNLTLQTAVMVRDVALGPQLPPPGYAGPSWIDPNGTNQLVCFTEILPNPQGDPYTPPLMRHYPDIQANISSIYDANNKLLRWSILEQDPIVRAQYYIAGMTKEFQYKPGQTVQYNGIQPIQLDGLNWQITWESNESGVFTTITQNGEHSIWVPPYRARRRAEYLPPLTEIDRHGNRVNMTNPPRATAISGLNQGNIPAGFL